MAQHSRRELFLLIKSFCIPVRDKHVIDKFGKLQDHDDPTVLFCGYDPAGRLFIHLPVQIKRYQIFEYPQSLLVYQAISNNTNFFKTSLDLISADGETADQLLAQYRCGYGYDFLKLSILLAGRPIMIHTVPPPTLTGKPDVRISLKLYNPNTEIR